MLGGELLFHFLNTVIVTAIVSTLVLWRYRHLVLAAMGRAGDTALPAPLAPEAGLTHPPDRDFARRSRAWERGARRRLALVYLATVALSGLLLAALYLGQSGLPHSPAHFALVVGVYLSAAVPMISVSLAIPFWRAVAGWVLLMLAAALFMTFLAMAQRPFQGRLPSLDQFMNVLYFFQLAAVQLPLSLVLLLATGASRLRGVAPITFAVLLVFGLAPLAGTRLNAQFAATQAGSNWLLSTVDLFGLDAVFLLLALPAGGVAWKRLHALGRAYAAKKFSDAQLLARTWWLMFVATVAVELINAGARLGPTVAGCVAAYAAFPVLNGWLFSRAGIGRARPAPRTLLLLRVFGYTARTQRLFDRIGARWRLHGPITMIAAPDIVARTIDPADFLGYLRGQIDASFVRSEADLKRRLGTLDLAPDPDGRYRINEFCCRDATWQATVLALMARADAVVMDLRGVKGGNRGCEFELRELGKRVAPGKIVLIVDHTTDQNLIDSALAGASPSVRRVRIERGNLAETDRAFNALLEAAGA